MYRFPGKTGHTSRSQLLPRSSVQAWQLWVSHFMVNGTKPPKQERWRESEIYTVLMGLPFSYQVSLKNARREYEIISELSRSHFHHIFQSMSLSIIFLKGIFWDQQAYVEFWRKLLAHRLRKTRAVFKMFLKYFLRKYISVLPVWKYQNPSGTHPRLASSL